MSETSDMSGARAGSAETVVQGAMFRTLSDEDTDEGRSFATEWILVMVIASSRVRGGNTPGRRDASMVLPQLGGPTRRRL